MSCEFCQEFAESPPDGPESGGLITESQGWILIADIGAFTPGYCLYMPIDHIEAVADAGPGLDRVREGAEEMRRLVAAEFGPTIIAEHGPRGCDLGAGCCSHAHLHLIPVPDPDRVTAAYRTTGGPGRRLDDLSGLAGAVDGSYVYLSPEAGEHYVWPSQGFARQYVRRVCSTIHGRGSEFDWREHPQPANKRLTVDVLRASRATYPAVA